MYIPIYFSRFLFILIFLPQKIRLSTQKHIQNRRRLHQHISQLEYMFMKHYAPNHMPDPKGEWTLKENNSELHHGIYSKVNQFIYTLVCNYMLNIRILAKAVLQIFRSQGCSYTKWLCPENESNSTESLWNVLKS